MYPSCFKKVRVNLHITIGGRKHTKMIIAWYWLKWIVKQAPTIEIRGRLQLEQSQDGRQDIQAR